MTTIYDVARLAGVSPATVSRVFNGSKVSPARTAAVRAAADQLGFFPNGNARRLRMGSSQIVALLIPDVANVYYTDITRGLGDALRQAGYSVMLGNTDDEAANEEELLRAAVADPVAGIVMAPTSEYADLSLPISRGIPVVAIDRVVASGHVDTVVPNNPAVGHEATTRLYQAGYRRIACISGPRHVTSGDQRVEGWAQAIRDLTGTDPDPALEIRGQFTLEFSERAVKALLELPQPPDAIMAANNLLAIGAYRALVARDLEPPRIGLAGIGDLKDPIVALPHLIMVPLPARAIGLAAGAQLLERMGGYEGPARTEILSSDDTRPSPTAATLPSKEASR